MKPRTFLRSLYFSITSAGYYLDVLKAPFWFSFRFFLIAYFVFGILSGLRTYQGIENWLSVHSDQISESIQMHFPADGSIIWNSSTLSVSPDPFKVQYPEQIEVDQRGTDYVAILTSTPVSPSAFLTELNTSAPIVLAGDTAHTFNYLGDWTSAPLSQVFGDQLIIITPQTLPQQIERVRSMIADALPVLSSIIPLFAIPVLMLSRLWIAVLDAALIYLLFRINAIPISFLKSYQLTLHLLVPLELIHQLATYLYPELTISLFNIGFWALIVFIYLTQRKELEELYNSQQPQQPRTH